MRSYIVYLYCPTIATSSVSLLLYKSEENQELPFYCYLTILLLYLSLSTKKVICSVVFLRGEPSGLKIPFEVSTFDPTNELAPVSLMVNQ